MAWNEEMIQCVWEKGRIASGNDKNRWRKDECGAWMGRQEYGKRDSEYGWEIDHISPGGTDELDNLRPLQWQNNAGRSDGPLRPAVTADGKHNVSA
jgi:hypothetical protein